MKNNILKLSFTIMIAAFVIAAVPIALKMIGQNPGSQIITGKSVQTGTEQEQTKEQDIFSEPEPVEAQETEQMIPEMISASNSGGGSSSISDGEETAGEEPSSPILDKEIIGPLGSQSINSNLWIEIGPVFGEFDGGPKAYYPSVIYDKNRFSGNGNQNYYKMWYGTDGSQTGLAVSDDGLSWTDKGVAMTKGYHAFVMYNEDGFNGSDSGENTSSQMMYYRMWYWVPNVIYTIDSIDYAESPDGLAWFNYQNITQENSTMIDNTNSSNWNRGSYGPGDVIYNDNATNIGPDPFDYSFVMYYDATTGGLEQIGLAYSADALHWTGYGKVLANGDTGEWDDSHSGFGNLLYIDDSWHMWYSGGQGSGNNGIGYATSDDGLNWTRDADNPIFHINDNVTYRYSRTYTPSMLLRGNKIKMFFSCKGDNYSICYAYNIFTCINATEDMVITEDTTLCPGTFNIDQGITINASNVVLDCDGAELIGNGNGTGIFAQGDYDLEHWMNETNNLGNVSAILDNLTGFTDSITFLEDIEIKNCNIRNFEYGMNLTAINNSRIMDNHVESNTVGILAAGMNSLIDNNYAWFNSQGILAGGINVSVTDNEAYNNSGMGIGLGGINCTAMDNIAQNNNDGISGIGFDNKFIRNIAEYNANNGIGLLFVLNNKLINNSAENNGAAGISLAEATGNLIANNTLDNNDIGLMLRGFIGVGPSDANIIDSNVILDNDVGIKFNHGNLLKLFAMIKNVAAAKLGFYPRHTAPDHQITNTVIVDNILNNTEDLVTESSSLKKSLIIYNEFNGDWDMKGLSEDNDILSNSGECIQDSDCDDDMESTLDRCIDTTCFNQVPAVYGKVVDHITGEPLAGKDVSLISVNDCNAANDSTGDGDCILEPKEKPDAITDENGLYAIIASPGVYNMVFSGSREDVLNRYVTNEVDNIDIPENGTIEIVVEPERIEAGFHSTAYIMHPGTGDGIEVIHDSHVTQTPTFLNVTSTDDLEFFITVHGTYPQGIGDYNISSSDHNKVIIDQLDGNTWRLWFEDLPDGHPWLEDNRPKEPDYDDVIFLIDFEPSGENFTNETDYDCDDDGIPDYLDEDDECDTGDDEVEIVNQTDELYAEGHILHEGKYRKSNRYVCGDNINFVIFGINNLTDDDNVTFLIEDHTVEQGVNGTVVYYGNLSNDDERLDLPNDGSRKEKVFTLTLPCFSTENDGRHDIHIVHDGSKWHKIGDFFMINDTTAPFLWTESYAETYTNQSVAITYNAYEVHQENTINDLVMCTESCGAELEVYIDQQDDGSVDSVIGGGLSAVNLTFNESGHYTVRFFVNDSSGNIAEQYANISVYITEEEADLIGDQIYYDFGVLPKDLDHDFFFMLDPPDACSPSIEWDRWDDGGIYMGDEYMSPFDSNTLSQAEKECIDNANAICDGGPFGIGILPSTSQEYNDTLRCHLCDIKCRCSYSIPGGSCASSECTSCP